MHIVYLHQYFCPPEGSGNNRSYEFAKEWAKKHKVTVITTKAYFPKHYFDTHTFKNGICELNIDDIHVKVLNIEYSHSMNYMQRVKAFVKYAFYALQYVKHIPDTDIIYASSTPLSVGWIAYQMYKKQKIPYFFEAVDLWPDVPVEMGIIRNPLLKKWLYTWEKKIYDHATAIITLSQGMTDRIIKKGVPKNKVYTIPNGTNTDFFKPCSAEEKKKHKENLGFKENSIIALYSGTVGRANGVQHLVEIARLAKEDNLQVKFVILGTGNRIQNIKSLTKYYELKNIYFYETVPKAEILPYLYASDIGMITFESYPILNTNSANKFFDYLAVGLPICANYEGWQADIGHNIAGLFAPCKKTNIFYENLKKMVECTELRIKFAYNAVKISEKFNRKHLSTEVLTLLEKYYERK